MGELILTSSIFRVPFYVSSEILNVEVVVIKFRTLLFSVIKEKKRKEITLSKSVYLQTN